MVTRVKQHLAAMAFVLGCVAPTAPGAHPHVFIDAGLRLIFEGNRVTAVEVTWLYDELYSLILLEDYGLDPDFDLELTQAERDETLGFDLNWNSGFEGALELVREGQVLEIGAPEPVSLDLVAPGQFLTTHRRPVSDPVGAGAVHARAFDRDFFVAMEMSGAMGVAGTSCETELVRADLDAAYDALQTAIDELGGAIAAEDNFPPMGEWFTDEVVVTCAGCPRG